MLQLLMKAPVVAASVLLAAKLAVATSTTILSSGSMITPAPQLRRQVSATGTDDPIFIGWYATNGTYEPITCGNTDGTSGTWSTSGSIGGCCAQSANSCLFSTGCVSVTDIVDALGSTGTCPSGFTCAAITVIQTSPIGGATVADFNCFKDWNAWTAYRETVTATSSSSFTTSPSTVATSTPIYNTPQPTTTITVISQTSTTIPQNTSTSGKSWIAAAVVVPIALLALASGFWFWRRRRQQPNQGHEMGWLINISPQTLVYEKAGQEHKPSPHELSGVQERSPNRLSELDG